MDGRRILGLIPARAGSERLPGKAMRSLAGRPLVDWTFQACALASGLDHVVVSSDDAAVLDRARGAGLDALERPARLAGPDASVIDAVAHALEARPGPWDRIVLLQPTSPLRTAQDIDGAIELSLDRGAAVIGVSPPAKPAAFHGRVDADGRFFADPWAEGACVINGAIYVARPEAVLRDRSFAVDALAWIMPWERSVDIDTAQDFAVAEALARLPVSSRP